MAKKPTYEALEQRIEKLEGQLRGENQDSKIEVSDINIAWDKKRGTCTFENLPVAMMWVDTTLAGLMSGTQAMVGTKRFRLALQSEGRKSVEADWNIISQFSNFRDGFKAIANIAAVAGWGNWKLISLQMEKQKCLFRIWDSWEGRYQKALGVCWGSSMLAGKMAGYCSRFFETNCWADQSAFIARGDAYDEFTVGPSERSIEQESENLLATDEATRADLAVALKKLQKEVGERKHAEEALRGSEEKYRKLFDELPDVFYRTDTDGNLVLVSPSFTKVLGYSLEEAIGMNVAGELYAGPSPRDVLSSQLRRNGSAEGFEVALKHKTGSIIWVSANSRFCYDELGNVAGFEGIFRDITEWKRVEEEKKDLQTRLQRAAKMEAIGTLAGGVAHDLNNVLGGIVSYPDLILIDLPEDSHLREPVLTIQDSGKKAAAIVQDLLTLARRGVSVSEVINLNDVVSDYLKSPEHEKLKIFSPGAQFKIDLQGDLLNIMGSPVHLAKTIMNLVSNAVESLPAGGIVAISTRNEYIDRPLKGYDEVQDGDYAVLTVTDNGAGIAAEDLKKIFEPFYTKKVMGRSGTGLGMAVVWGSIKDHNGYIDVESTVGKGSKFTLYFPITRKEGDKGASLSIEEYTGNGEKILVVDDVLQQRQIASVLLKKLGYSVDVVSSGEDAVEYFRKNSADLLILDMIMDPGIDGLDTYKKVLEMHPGQRAVLASGYSETDRVKEAQKLGAGPYIKKPYTLEKIGLVVKAELSR